MKHFLNASIRLLAIGLVAGLPLIASLSTDAATPFTSVLSVSPASQSVTKGSNVSFNINLDTKGYSVANVKILLSYSTSVFGSGSLVTAGGSPFAADPDSPSQTAASGGVIRMVRYTSSPQAYNGPIATVTLSTVAAGTGSISFGTKCAPGDDGECNYVLEGYNDGVIENIIGTMSNGSVTVANPVVTPPPSGGSGSGGTTSGSTGGTTTTPTKKGGSTSSSGGTKTTTPSTPSTNTPAPTTTKPEDKTTSDTTNDTTAETASAVVRLTLVDEDGKPLAGAKVVIDGVTGTTDKDGKVTLNGVSTGLNQGKVTYKGDSQTISLNVNDASTEPVQSSKITVKVKKTGAVAPVAITLVTLIIVAGAALALIGPGKGLGSLAKKLPLGNKPKAPKPTPPVAPAVTKPAPSIAVVHHETPAPRPQAPAPTPPPAPSAQKPLSSRRIDPLAPGTTFTPTEGERHVPPSVK